MSTRRSLKQPVASMKKSLKNDPRYREMLRRAARKFHLETLEDRRVYAIDPVLVQADGGVAFNTGTAPTTVRNESPRELTFTFPAVPGMDRTTLANGIRLLGANKDNIFNANDITYTPAYLDLGNDPTQVVMRFATPLPDDLYQIQFIGSVLRDTDGLPFNLGASFNVDFRLNLAPQILAVVPQPIDRNANGTLTQRTNQVDVYFNNDDLDPTRAEDPQYYRLLITRGTVDPLDDATGLEIVPADVNYDPIKDKAVLTFSQDIHLFGGTITGVADPAVAYRLRIGTNETRRPNVYGVDAGGATTDYLTSDPGSTFTGAANLRDALAKGLVTTQTLEQFINQGANSAATHANVLKSGTSVIIGQSIDPQFYNLIWPGGNDDPGHRDLFTGNHPGATATVAIQNRTQTVVVGNDIMENHLGSMYALNPLTPPAAAADQVNGVTTYYYNFRSELGYVPDTSTGTIPNQPTFNIITERQKQRAREVLELIGQYSGVNFVETEQQGFIIATGDMRAILTTVQTGAGGLTGLAGTVDLNNDGIAETAAAIMDSGEDWASNGGDLYGNAWFVTAMHEISEVLGLGHSYDLPATTVQGNDPSLSAGLPGAEPVFPGDADIAHMQHVYRPESKDIDLYRFELDQAGVFTAEVFAERLANSSQLDSALSIYRVNPSTQQPELFARNDDYFSKDAFIELELPAGVYYVGVSASGNIEYDPNVFDSGMGGTTQGAYQLKLDFRKIATQTLTDNSGVAGAPGVAFDGDSDGKPGGVNNFWFRSAAQVSSLNDLQSTTRTARTIFVDRLGGGDPLASDTGLNHDGDPDNAAYVPDGSLARPFLSIKRALQASKPFDIIRIVGNNLATTADTADPDLKNNLAYQIGFDRLGNPLPDGSTLDVPKDRTVMFDAGAVVQLRRAQISVGSENQGASADRSGGALQVLGTPWQQVYFTSYNRTVDPLSTSEPQIGEPENSGSERADEGDWGGISFRNDIDQADGRFDFERRGIFLNYISNADIRYGGGQVVVNSTARTVNPIHLTDARPTIINNRITLNADAAMSANPDSFEESNFSSPQFGSTFNTSFNVDYNRVGPEIHGNILLNNTVNALAIRSRTQSGTLNVGALEEMNVAGRFDDTDIVHVIQENLVMHSNPGGALVHTSLSAPGTTLTVATPVAGTGGFVTGPANTPIPSAQIEYKIVYVDANGNEGLASNTVRVTGTITTANSHIRLTNLPNVTASLVAQGFVGRRLYRRIGGTGDFVLVEQIPASASSTYTDRNVPLPASALKLKVAATSDSMSPRILQNTFLNLPAVTTTLTANAPGGQYAAGTRVVYGLAYVDTEGRDTPMVEVPIAVGGTLGPNGSVTLNGLPATYGQYMGLRIYRSIAGGQFNLIGMVDGNTTTFTDTGAPAALAYTSNGTPLVQEDRYPATVDITATVAPVPPPAGGAGFTNGQIVNYRFTYFGAAGETASSALAVTAGESRGYVISGNNRQITIANLPDIDDKQFSSLQIYRSINYGRFELIEIKTLQDQLTAAGFFFVDTNPANPAPTYLTDATLSPPAVARARPHGTLVIDPSIVVKSDGARIDATIGTSIIAEGVKGRNIVMTSLYDQRYGAGGTFSTSKSTTTAGEAGDWAGIYFAPDSKGSFNEVVFAYGGGETRIEGTFTGINVLEIQQAKVRVANSRFEFNENGVVGDQAPVDRSGRGTNDEAVIFVRGAQPVIVNNTVVSNQGSFISINANGMNSFNTVDFGRQTGLLAELPVVNGVANLSRISFPVSRLTDTQTAVTDVDNNGPLIRLNKLDGNAINGMRVRGGVLTTETVWDDTDIVHVLFDSILIPDFHTYGGLRLESSARESLVVKSASDENAGTTAGFIANGRPLEIEDRIGGTLQVLGQPGFPVVMTSFSDDTISAGLTPSGKPQANTNGDALLAPLPTIGEVDNGLTIDNDVATTVNGHFGLTVNAAGSFALATGSTATAQGLVGNYIAQNLLNDYFPVVISGNTRIDLQTTVTTAPFLNAADEVISEGEFTGVNGQVHWKATSRFLNGSTRLTTSFEFNSVTPGAPLGALRLVSYMDQNIGASAVDDVLYLHGSPGQADFRLLTLDNTDKIGFALGGIYAPGTGLTNAKYVGFAADKFQDLRTGLLPGGTYNNFAITVNPVGQPANVDLTDLPLLNDPALGNVYGQGNVTSALAWDMTATASSSTITTFLELFPQSPVVAGRPGEWQGITVDKYANDRNVETVPEREPVSSNGSQNSRPSKAQFLGTLAGANKGGDENLRLGFVVQGAVSTVADVDIYSFKAKSETEVWFDIDRTSQALDAVLELVDEFGNVLARSDNSADESAGADSLIGEGALPLQKTTPYEGIDLYSTNVRDPGMRVKLPGPPGVESTYFVRVRSVPRLKGDLDTAVPANVSESLVTPGVSFGAYELQVRLREQDEKGGTTIRYSRIANAVTGIDVNGLPAHSPLGGEQRDEEPNNIGSLLGAQELGNLLSVDRGAISVGGTINTIGETDWYTFTLDYTNIDGASPVSAEYPSLQSLVNTVFDLDYADGLGRPNMQMFVYDATLNLILSNFDSNIADDRGNALAGGALNDLGRGSVGFNDSYIGNISLPASTPFGGAPQRYYVAITGIGTTPTVMNQFTSPTSANPLLRMEPLDSVRRIVEDHLSEGSWAGPYRLLNEKPEVPFPAGYPFLPFTPPDRGTSNLAQQEILFDQVAGNDSAIPWHLGDTTLYLLRDSGAETTTLDTFNPFTGTRMTVVGSQPYDIRDIDFNGTNLFGLTRDVEVGPFTDAGSGHLIRINTTNGGATDLGGDGIITYAPEFGTFGDPVLSNQPFGMGIHYDAMAYGTGLLYGVGSRGEAYLTGNPNPLVETRRNIVYQLSNTNGSAIVDSGTERDIGAWTSHVEAGEILTEFRFTSVEATNTLLTASGNPLDRQLATNPLVPDPATGNDSFISTANASFNIRDGEQFTVADGDISRNFEFDAGFDFVQTVIENSDQTVRDGYYFILDRDDTFSTTAGGTGAVRNEAIYQFDTGPVIVVNQGINSINIPDGASFVINVGGTGGFSKIFEFDKDGVTFPGTIPVTLAPAPTTPPTPPPIFTAPAIAALIQDAINGAYDDVTFPLTAYVNGASSRISLFPDNPNAPVNVPPNGFSDSLKYADAPANTIPFLKVFTEGATGAAPVLQAHAQPAVAGDPGDLDGQTFTIRQPNLFGAITHTFEFDANGVYVPATNKIRIPINYGDTGSQVAAAMTTAIQTLQAQYGITGNQYNNDDRVVVNGSDVTFTNGTSPVRNLMATQANGGLMVGGGLLINAKEAYPVDPDVDLRTTGQRIADAILNTVNTNPQSPFIVGAEASQQTGRVNFPPITTIANRVPVVGMDADGNPIWTAALDDSGNPNSIARPGVSSGAIPIPFLAHEWANRPNAGDRQAIDPITGNPIIIQGGISQLSIAARVEQAINTNLTPSTGITARSEGPYVYLNRGRILLPPAPGSPFLSQGPIAPLNSNPPGGNITGMVHLPAQSGGGLDVFLAISDKGGLFEVTVDWFTNQNDPLEIPPPGSGIWNQNKFDTVTTRYIADSEFDLTGLNFQGLTRGPGTVENGRYVNTWFAVADGALVPPANSIVAPAGTFVESEQNNSLPPVANPTANTFDESFVTHLIPNPISGTMSVYQNTLTNAFLGNGAFGATTGDYDFYRLQANAGEVVTAEVLGAGSSSNRSLIDSYITIYNSAGNIVAQDDNSGNGFDARASFTVPVNGAGAYFVAVRSGGSSLNLTNPFNGATGSGANFTGTYDLQITRQVDEGSRLHAFSYNPATSAYGGMQPIFADGNTSLPLLDRLGNPIQDAVGLRFGELQRNLWTMTPFNSPNNQHRQYDPGHGTLVNENTSRPATDGHSSFYFGRGGVGTTYDFNNGAAGSIISNEFSLEGYSAIDQPVLYFTYFSDHEQSLYDSMRLFISGIEDNNADQNGDGVADTNSGDWWPLSFDDQSVVPVVNVDGTTGFSNVGVQPNFTVGAQPLANGGGWRQVRIPLDLFAGQQGLRLRFDFSTAGDMDVGNTDTTGEEIRTVSGEFITDGQFISVNGQTFELNSGVTATFSSGRATPDGERLTLTDSFGITTTFEFDKDGIVAGTNTRVIITDEMTPQQVTQSLLDLLLVPANSIVDPFGFNEFFGNDDIPTADESFVTHIVPNATSATQAIYQSVMTDGFLGDGAFGFTSGDYDAYHVQANDGESIIAAVQGTGSSALFTLTNSYVTIYNSAGIRVAGDDNSGPGNDALARYQVPAGGAGDYYVIVRSGGTSQDLANPFNGGTGSGANFTGTYGLTITRTSALFAETSFLGTASTVDDAVLTFHGMSGAVALPPVGAPLGTGVTTVMTGAVGINDPNAIELPYRRDDSRTAVATTLRDALEQFYYQQQLVVNAGAAYTDGQLFDLTDIPTTITGVTPALPTTTVFEFEAGEIIDFPDDGADNTGTNYIVDGDEFEVTYTNAVGFTSTRRFEFDNDNIFTATNVRVRFNTGEADTVIVNSVAQALISTFPGMQARVVSGARVQLDTDINVNTVATFDPTFNPANGTYAIIGAVGVTLGNQPVYYTESNGFSVVSVANRIANAITAAGIPGLTAGTTSVAPNRVTLFSQQDYILNPDNPPVLSMQTATVNNVKQYEDLVRLISTGASVNTGTDKFIDFVGGVPQRGPFGWEAILPGDLSDAQGGMASNLRGQNNNFEGVYLDDFVIGLAERGEMITGVSTPVTTTNTVGPLDPLVVNQVRLGDYQLEIRRGVGYDFVAPGVPTFTADSNDRFTAQQTLLARPGAEIVDGQTFTISDGNRQLTFEFNDINQFTAVGDVVTPGNQEIPYHSLMKDYEVAAAIRDAINQVDVQQILAVNAWMGDGVQPGLITTTNRVNLNGAATFKATGTPVVEPNQNIATALEISPAGVVYDGLRFFANGTIGDSDDSVTSQLDQGRRDRDVDYFGLDLVAGQRIIVDVDAATLGSTLDSYLRIFNSAGVLQNVDINGVTYTAENDGPTIPMLFPGGTFSTTTISAPGELPNATQVIGNTYNTRPETDSALVFIAPTAGRYYIAVSGATNNRYNPVDGTGAIPGSTGTYQLEVTSPNAPGANSAGINSAIDVITFDEEYGDRNLPRDQGQLIIQGNEVYNSLNFGIDIDAGSRTAGDGNAAHQGGVRNLAQSNSLGLLTSVVVMNNVIYDNELGGIRFSGDPGNDAPVPYGRIVNNTLFGKGGTLFPPPTGTVVQDTGILISERAGPTLLNNIIANFNTGINVDASSRPNTVIGGIVTQGNTTLSVPANVGFGDFPILLSDQRLANGQLRDPLFRNPTGANFYLDSQSRAIDSSVDSLLDRPLMVTIKAPLGLGESPILSPDRDSRGQVRADDPDVQTPQGFGLNPFKDRGAIDRVDKTGPSSGLINPQDNDSFGIDRDIASNVVSTDNTTIVRNFTVALFDRTDPNGEPDGSDIDDFTVTTNQVIVTRRTSATTESVLVDGVDYFFSYDATSNQIVLTPVGNVWARGTYRIYMNDGILDQAGNKLSANNNTLLPNPVLAGDTIEHYYDIFLGTAVDYGDAPINYPVLSADNGANHFIVPGVSLGTLPSADFDGKPSLAATLDSDDGVNIAGSAFLPGVTNGSSVIVTAASSGIKLSVWIDNDGVVGWNDTTERVLHNVVLTQGTNVIQFTTPSGARGATYARFRVSSQNIDSAVGPAVDGEVEDYQVTLTGPLFQNGRTIQVDRKDPSFPGPGPDNIGFMDVNDDGFVTAIDAIIVISYLNLYPLGPTLPIAGGPKPLPSPLPPGEPPAYIDVNGDNRLTAFDANEIVTYLNNNPLTPGAPESVTVGGGSAPEHAGEPIDGEVTPDGLALNLLLPGELYASSSVVIETPPAAAQQRAIVVAGSPVEEMMHEAVIEAALLAMAERQAAVEEVSFEAYEDVEAAAGPLTDGQWADLLDELALEQLQS